MTVSHGAQPLLGHQNRLRDATVESDDALANHPVSQMTDGRTATQAGFASGSGEVIFDMGAAVAVDYAGLTRHNLADESATLTIEHGDAAGGPWTQFLSDAPGDNSPHLWQVTSVTKRYWRVTLSGHSNRVYLADLTLGAVLKLPAGMPPNWSSPRFNRQDEMRPTRSRAGHLVGLTREPAPREAEIRMRAVDASWVDANWESLEADILSYPFYFVYDADNRPDEVFYCWLRDKMPKAPYNTAGKYQTVSIEVEGITE